MIYFILKPTLLNAYLSFNLCNKDNNSESDGDETKIEFRTDHGDKYGHENDITKEIDKSTLPFVELEPMEVMYFSSYTCTIYSHTNIIQYRRSQRQTSRC